MLRYDPAARVLPKEARLQSWGSYLWAVLCLRIGVGRLACFNPGDFGDRGFRVCACT